MDEHMAIEAIWLLEIMKEEFPGLWNGEEEVNGSDLVAWLTEQLSTLDAIQEPLLSNKEAQ